MLMKTNDMHMAIYLSALIRSVLAIHDLINNKIRYGENDDVPDSNNSGSGEEEKKEDDKKETEKIKDSKTNTEGKKK